VSLDLEEEVSTLDFHEFGPHGEALPERVASLRRCIDTYSSNIIRTSDLLVEGKGFIASRARLSAYFAENSRRQTALEGPLEPFRVPIRPHFLGSRHRQNRASLRQTPWTTRRAREVGDLSVDGPPLQDVARELPALHVILDDQNQLAGHGLTGSQQLP